MVFVTGFPGFLATEFMLRWIKKDQNAQFICLIQSKFKNLAEASALRLLPNIPAAQIQLIEGDITQANLGIIDQALPSKISRIFHFAAIYDLSVSKALGIQVNQEGTRNVLNFAKRCQKLERLDYVSTCYVSGRYAGKFFEEDLEKGQNFNNFYESTKYEAERLVRTEMGKGLPCTIYRPAVVVGNSVTGITQKFDGPYYMIQWLLRQPNVAFLPRPFHPEHYTLNLVPSDFVLDAMAALASQGTSLGKTFQLADPDPLSILEIISCLELACDRKVVEIPLPKTFAKTCLKFVPGLERWLGIPRASLDYFDHPCHYDVSNTLAGLKNTGITCPSFRTYAPKLVRFMQGSPEVRNHSLS